MTGTWSLPSFAAFLPNGRFRQDRPCNPKIRKAHKSKAAYTLQEYRHSLGKIATAAAIC